MNFGFTLAQTPRVARLSRTTLLSWARLASRRSMTKARPGETYSRLPHALEAAGFTDAVLCDGSDSTMLWVSGRMIVSPGERKPAP